MASSLPKPPPSHRVGGGRSGLLGSIFVAAIRHRDSARYRGESRVARRRCQAGSGHSAGVLLTVIQVSFISPAAVLPSKSLVLRERELCRPLPMLPPC